MSNRLCRKIILIILLLVISGPAPSQTLPADPRFEHLTVDDGLPDSSVRAIVQDRLGFLWFGTQNGLVRYDGQELLPYAPFIESTGQYLNIGILSLLEDRDGDLWIGTFASGLWRLHSDTGQFDHWGQDSPDERQIGGFQVDGLCQAPDGTIWAALNEGWLAAVDPMTGLVRRHRRQPGGPAHSAPPDSKLTSVLVDTAERLWVTSEGQGVAYLAPGSDSWHHFRHDPDKPASVPSDIVMQVHQDDRGRIWVTTRMGLARFNEATQGFTRYVPVPDAPEEMLNYLVKVEHDAEGRLWIGAADGMYGFEPDTGRFQHYDHDPEDDNTVLDGPMLSIYCDSAGIVWGGTWHAGLNKIDPGANQFRVVTHDHDDPDSLDYGVVQGIFEDSRGVLWVGTGNLSSGIGHGGLNSRLPGETKFRHHPFPEEDAGLPTTIQAICEDRRGSIWIGTDHGLWTLPRGKTMAERVPGLSAPGDPVHATMVRALAIDEHGHVWAGSYGEGVRVFEPESSRLRHYEVLAGEASQAPDRDVVGIHRDRRGRMWVLFDTHGLAYYDEETDSLVARFDPDRGLVSPMSAGEDLEGTLWVGTFAGLLRLDHDGRVVEAVSMRDGLPNDQVGSLLPDVNGALWMSTDRGFARYDPRTREMRSFDTRDGLPTNKVHFGYARGNDGTIYFGGRGGLVSFDPTTFHRSEFVPPVVVTALRIADREVRPGPGSPLTRAIELTDSITLAHDQNDITLSYAALHFARPEHNRYRYRLDGADDNWRDPGRERRATYTNLSPGRYTFRVRGSNADGVWNEEETRLDIRILHPWWQSAKAKLVYMLLALGIVAMVYRQIIQRIRIRTALEVERAEAQQWQDLDKLRKRFFSNVSHEFRTPLTLLRTPLQRLREAPDSGNTELFAMMSRNADRLGQLIDQLLDLSRLEAGRLPLHWGCDDVTVFLRTLLTGFEPLAGENDIDLLVQIPENPEVLWFDADLLEKVTVNLVTNAVKHTPPGGRIVVNATVAATPRSHPIPVDPGSDSLRSGGLSRGLCLSVANTGSYIPPAEHELVFDRFQQLAGGGRAGGSGVGLALVKELVTLLEGSVHLTSDSERGTCFTVELPLFLEPPFGKAGESCDPAADAAAPAGETATEDKEAPSPGRQQLLVAEDNHDLREYLARELGSSYDVITASNGEVALQLALAQIPDLVISDVMMPVMDGLDLCRRLKTDWRTCHVPVILLTAKVGIENRLTGLEQGADDYLAKPFDARELLARIANLTALRRQLQERFADRVKSLDPEPLPVTSMDDRFLQRCREIIDDHLEDDLSVAAYAREVGLSRGQLHRKLTALTDLGPREFIRSHRLHRAAELLRGRYGNVTEVAYSVGFKSLSHFTRCFREQFGIIPSSYPDGNPSSASSLTPED